MTNRKGYEALLHRLRKEAKEEYVDDFSALSDFQLLIELNYWLNLQNCILFTHEEISQLAFASL